LELPFYHRVVFVADALQLVTSVLEIYVVDARLVISYTMVIAYLRVLPLLT
jgi:hypothetical protein